ncbi:three prime repair exonuclease 2 [Bombina bombina]|uniref:three prime repair exonuclease 2 n=1 Tax=Bombina bombina TaxID=8345 RepID=UPI00235B1894|nr:three prime repair exonuclease 2 [Bombina bombina]
MANSIKTFVFLDLEATGLNQDAPRITELCLVAVHLSSLANPVMDDSGKPQLPRVLDKLCLCVDPDKPFTEGASKITGLNNDNLCTNEKTRFDQRLIKLLSEFLDRQAQPVCLVAHNGFYYDFPLLKTELKQQNEDFPSSLLCLDSLSALRNLDKMHNPQPNYGRGYHTLPQLYRRCFDKDPVDSHYAEGDVLTLIMVFLCKATELLEMGTSIYKRWGEIKPMYGQGQEEI